MANQPPRPPTEAAKSSSAPAHQETQAVGPDLGATGDFSETAQGSPALQATSDVIPPPKAAPSLQETDAGSPTAPGGKTEAGPGTSTDKSEEETTTLKDFRLLKKLGEGGMGTVYKAHQISLDRVVAVKVPFKHLAKDESFVQRFYREARIMAKLDHPNILRCFSVGEENGFHYLAMEFIDGASMQSWIKRLGKLSLGDALHVILACAEGLQHAHEQNMIHRDIKPDNIMVTNKGVVKVADMGLAKALTDDLNLSRTGTGAGTPYYMSPEQARDAKHVDGRSDIYALGTMLYCFLTGNPPFKGETYVELLLAKEAGKFPPARRSNSEIPERLDLIIDKMVAVKPEHRYKTCADVIRDLTALGLANPVLSFLPQAQPVSVSKLKTMPETKAASPSSRPSAAATATRPPSAPARPPAPEPAADSWFLSYHTPAGKPIKRKLTTAQIRELIKSKDFDLDAKVSRSLKGPYKNLGSFKEFEQVLTGRMVKAKAEKKTAQLKDVYQNILKQEKSYYRWRAIGNMFRTAGGMITFAIWLGILGGLAFVLYLYGGVIWSYIAGLLHLN
jgi:serine/threonine-protein kinase